MTKDGFLTPKAIANRIKAKGLQKLRWYCQMCQKQCRDENGFKCHCESESHQRQMGLFASRPGRFLDAFSREFEKTFMDILKRRFGEQRVHANIVYNEYISDRHHTHMNATGWVTLTGFVKYLGRTGKAIVEETPKGWYIQYIDRDPEKLARDEAQAKKEKHDLDDEERTRRMLEKRIQEAQKHSQGFSREDDENQSLATPESTEPIKFSLNPRKPNTPLEEANTTQQYGYGIEFQDEDDLQEQLDAQQFDEQQFDEQQLDEQQLDEQQLDEQQLDEQQFDATKLDIKQELADETQLQFDSQVNQELQQPPIQTHQSRETEPLPQQHETQPPKQHETQPPKQHETQPPQKPQIQTSPQQHETQTPQKPRIQPSLQQEKQAAPVKFSFGDKKAQPIASSPSPSPSSKTTDRKRKLTAVEELMLEQERQKEKKNRKDYWVTPGIVVKVLNKKLSEGKYYKQKGVIEEVVNTYVAQIKMIESGDVLRLDQSQLETVIPTVGGKVKIVNGAYRGETAVLLGLDVDKFSAKVKLTSGPNSGSILPSIVYEDICKLSIQ